LVLKNTKMKLHYSTETFRTAVENMVLGQGILPDYPIEPTIDDLLAGKDMEMAKALELIGQK
ncbi:MAG: peptidase S41, partial [Clostridia bacterium]|nr:peptidase S41 [Clostridia bacterium]